MESPNVIQEHIKEIKKLFPDAVTEVRSGNAIKSVVDFTILEQELSDTVSGNLQERYQMTWPDKTQTFKNAYLPTSLTLRPLVSSSKNFEKTKNVYIEGDNLDALKILRETYLNKVKLVYVDPPYNTGNNLIYKNDFSQSEESFIENNGQNDQYGNRLFVNNDTNGRFHTDWLNMIYPRIKLARDFLTDDGFFVISIDQSELMNLIKVCDEIFGEENRINIVTVVHKPEGRNQEKFFGTSNEFALFYAKNKADANFRNVVLDQEVAKKFKDQDSLGNFRFQNFIRMTDGRLAYRSVRPKFWYPIYVNTTLKIMSVHKEKVPEPFETIFPITKVGVEMSWKLLPLSAEELINTNNLSFELDKSGFITIVEKIRETQVIKTHWIKKEYNAIQNGTKIVNDLLGANVFDFPKSLYLIEDILKLCLDKNDTVLDFFSGSATTAHACMLLNSEDNGSRKFILVQLPEPCSPETEAFKLGYKTICDIGKERIRRAGERIKKDSPLITNELDIGYRDFFVDTSNMKDIYYETSKYKQETLDQLTDNIKDGRSDLDLLFQIMIELGLPISSKINKQVVLGNNVYFVDENNLVACFDNKVNEELIKYLANSKPLYACFKDSSFGSDSISVNCEQIFKTISPVTKIKVI